MKRFPCFAAVAAAVLNVAAFERIALVDSFDFIEIFDCETKKGTDQIIDHVLETGADTVLWRNQTGGVVRFPSREENVLRLRSSVDKLRVNDERVFGWAALEGGETNLLDYALGSIRRRGKGCGLHYTFEENHHAGFTYGEWNLRHPQYWSRSYGGNPLASRCSFAYDEVLEHKMRILDELLASDPETLYLEFWRNGAWTPGMEYVEPVLARWRELYGDAPVPADCRDARWLKTTGFFMERYLRAIRARLDAHGKKVRFLAEITDLDLEDRAMWERFNVDWKRFAAEGLFDGLVVTHVRASPRDAWNSTRRIYEYVMENRGKCDVYFHASMYDYRPGIPSYCKWTGETPAQVAKRLCDLAKDVGGKGVILECVDYRNYPPEVNEVLKAAGRENREPFRPGKVTVRGEIGRRMESTAAHIRNDIDVDGEFVRHFRVRKEKPRGLPASGG